MDEELQASDETGYKVGDKKTIQELQSLDANDESLRKWKESLGLSASSPATDARKVIVKEMILQVQGRQDLVMDLTNIGFLNLIMV